MCRVLVVDDNRSTRRTITIGLRKEGFEVDEAASAEEALGELKATGYDYVISDVSMPGKGGLDLMEEGQHLCPGAKWILMSAYDPPTEEIQRRNLNPHTFLRKPFKISDLVRLMEGYGPCIKACSAKQQQEDLPLRS